MPRLMISRPPTSSPCPECQHAVGGPRPVPRAVNTLTAKRRENSAAGDAHVSRQRGPLMASVDNEIVPLGLAGDGLVDRGIQKVVALGGAQRRAQIGSILLAEAHIERAGAG